MAGEVDQLFEAFNKLGQLVGGFFQSENQYALFFVTLFVITILVYTILKTLLAKIPLFKGDGDRVVNTQGNVVAWCLALLGTISIGFSMRDQGPTYIVKALAGPHGIWYVVVIFGALLYGTAKTTDDWSINNKLRWGINLAFPLLVTGWLISHIFYATIGASLIVWLIVLIIIAVFGAILVRVFRRGP